MSDRVDGYGALPAHVDDLLAGSHRHCCGSRSPLRSWAHIASSSGTLATHTAETRPVCPELTTAGR